MPWNLSENEVVSSIDAMDQKMIKREVIEISDDEKETQTIELGRIVDYDQLRELFVDRSPLQSDTETDSEPDVPSGPSDKKHGDDEPMLIGATEDTSQPDPINPTDQASRIPIEPDNRDTLSLKDKENEELHGATKAINQEALQELRQELEISDEDTDNVLNLSSGSSNVLKGATNILNCTLEDAIWNESTREFLIVDDNILNMPDCTLSIKNLSEREIEIELDPRPKAIEQPKESDVQTVSADQTDNPDKHTEPEIDETEPTTEDVAPVQKPKIKIGSGKPKKRTRSKAKSSSESDTPRYSMRIKPTPRRLSSGGRALRSLRAINYQETYDYRTGRSREKPKDVVVPPAARTSPSAARQAAQAAIKDPLLLGATPAQTIPVLVLHNNAAEDSDNTIVYDDVEAESEDPPTTLRPTPGDR